MENIILNGFGTANWLPYLGVLVVIAVIIQLVEMSVLYFKRWRQRRGAQADQLQFEEWSKNDQNQEEQTGDFSAN